MIGYDLKGKWERMRRSLGTRRKITTEEGRRREKVILRKPGRVKRNNYTSKITWKSVYTCIVNKKTSHLG